jgi:RNA polymerase sigma factor for flagellar operon FliA
MQEAIGEMGNVAHIGPAVLLGVLPRPFGIDGRISVIEEVAETNAEASLSSAQEHLLLEHLPLVRSVARGIHEKLPQHVELDELIGAGMLGLLDAARRFNAHKNVQFRSYAQFRIRGAILDSLRSLDWSPRELRRKARAMEEARRALEARFGRSPMDSEVADELGVALLDVQQLAGKIRGLQVTTLNVERSEDSGEDELDFLPAKDTENPLFQCLEGEARRRVVSAVDALPERERLVLTLYYFEEKTMKEIGQVLGVVESRVSQIHQHALPRLRKLLADLRALPNNRRQGVGAARLAG